jgi:protoporphyrinogen/coproporphyrinogen III oxidase
MSGRVVVVGGGVAGLATAYRLVRVSKDLDVTILEAGPEPGGKVRSVRVGNLLLDGGPDSLIARKPWAVQLARELGLTRELVAPATGVTFVWTDHGLRRFPAGPFGIPIDLRELWGWDGMSRRGRIEALGDLVRKPRRQEGDEPLGALLRRRLGDEATDSLVAPLLGGLFAGDIDRLSALATFPELVQWERRRGSLIRGARAAARTAADATPPPPMFLRPRGGMRRLTDALAATLGDRVRCGMKVEVVEPEGPGYVVRAGEMELSADSVVLATPAVVSAGLLERHAPEAAAALGGIPHVSTGVALLVYAEGTGDRLPDISGFVVPRGNLAMTACTLVSRKWPDRVFGDRAVVRCFVGGSGAEDILDQPDDAIAEGVARQLAAILPLPAEPVAWRLVRWPRSMPQYEVGHLDRVAAIERALPPGTFLVGPAYRGPGIADCVRGGNEAAEAVRSRMAGRLHSIEGEHMR